MLLGKAVHPPTHKLTTTLAGSSGNADLAPGRPTLTFSMSWRSWWLRRSREQVPWTGMTAVQRHLPSGACAEV